MRLLRWLLHRHRWVTVDLKCHRIGFYWKPAALQACRCGRRRLRTLEYPWLPHTEEEALMWIKSLGEFNPGEERLHTARVGK